MRIFTHFSAVPDDAKGAVVAIGNFDGVHPGHRAVLGRAWDVAEHVGAPLGLVTFEPHPRRYFQPTLPPFRLTPAPAKRRLMQAAGVRLYYELPFDAAMAAHTAEAFIDEVLVEGLGVRHVVVGAGFAFGKGRTGTVSVLEHVAGHKGVGVTVVAPVSANDGALCSSTRVRECLQRGEPERAAALLGRPWSIEGPVEHGEKRGRILGFPTANLALDDFLLPAFGVYAVRVRLLEGGVAPPISGVANIGMRPTVGGTRAQLEAHLFDFAGDLYGKRLAVELHAFIRPERKFDGLDALKAQIAQDSARARGLLAGRPGDLG
ncbi:MAG: bifunctional riboflavin kinase/FAD synthetase [Rhodospirillaceae bacterium]|nr:bifunctional riboflavin kinase/FAD synthetase [Rhodospirillaceae bacterium]